MWDLIGYAGDVLFVAGHFLLSLGYVKPETRYQLLQIAAAGTLGLSAFMKDFGPTVALELVWIGISVCTIAKLRRKKDTTS